MHNPIKKVAIVGGTHGNELTGIYLINKFQKTPELVERESFETHLLHANKKAIDQCRRYIDSDLNRKFDVDALKDDDLYDYEELAAKQLNRILGPKGSDEAQMDFIVDLHTTTSNMGLSIVIGTDSALAWQAAAYLKEKNPQVHIFRWEGDTDHSPFVDSIAKHGFAIEVGAVPQGVLRADLFFGTEKLIQHLLDFFEKFNRGEHKVPYGELEIYDSVRLVDFPRDQDGEIAAMVHPYLQDNDYSPVEKGDPLFVAMDGREIAYQGEEKLYALFINEAAYYEKGFAMCLAKKRTLELALFDPGL